MCEEQEQKKKIDSNSFSLCHHLVCLFEYLGFFSKKKRRTEKEQWRRKKKNKQTQQKKIWWFSCMWRCARVVRLCRREKKESDINTQIGLMSAIKVDKNEFNSERTEEMYVWKKEKKKKTEPLILGFCKAVGCWKTDVDLIPFRTMNWNWWIKACTKTWESSNREERKKENNRKKKKTHTGTHTCIC